MEKKVSETESINIISGVPSALSSANSNPDIWVEKLVGAFLEHVDVGQLLFDIFKYSVNALNLFLIFHVVQI